MYFGWGSWNMCIQSLRESLTRKRLFGWPGERCTNFIHANRASITVRMGDEQNWLRVLVLAILNLLFVAWMASGTRGPSYQLENVSTHSDEADGLARVKSCERLHTDVQLAASEGLRPFHEGASRMKYVLEATARLLHACGTPACTPHIDICVTQTAVLYI
jgi:hypothetical protein